MGEAGEEGDGLVWGFWEIVRVDDGGMCEEECRMLRFGVYLEFRGGVEGCEEGMEEMEMELVESIMMRS